MWWLCQNLNSFKVMNLTQSAELNTKPLTYVWRD